MNEIKICSICKLDYTNGNTIRITDDKEKFYLRGHIECTDEVFEKLKKIDYSNMNTKQIMSKIKYEWSKEPF